MSQPGVNGRQVAYRTFTNSEMQTEEYEIVWHGHPLRVSRVSAQPIGIKRTEATHAN